MSDDARVMDQTWFFIYSEFNRTGRPVRSYDVIIFVSERAPSYMVQKLLDIMVQANFIERHADPKHGVTYTPRPRKKAPRPESDEELFGS